MKKTLFGALALVAMLLMVGDANAFGRRGGHCGGRGGSCGGSYGGCGQAVSYGSCGQNVSYGLQSCNGQSCGVGSYVVNDGFSQQWQPSAPVPAYQGYQSFAPMQYQQTQQAQQYQPGTVWIAGPDGILRQMNINQLQQQQQNPSSGERLVPTPSRKE